MPATFPIQIPGESAVSNTISDEGISSITSFIKSQFAATIGITLAADITSVATTIPVSDASGINTSNGLLIGTEVMLVTAKSGNSLTVIRHQVGTSAASATSGTSVKVLVHGNYSVYISNTILNTTKNVMLINPGPLVQAANLDIANQQVTILGLQNTVIVHVP